MSPLFWAIYIIFFMMIVKFGCHLMFPTNEPNLHSNKKTPFDFYEGTIKLLIHAANMTWQRLGTLLTANSILLLAWVHMYRTDKGKEKWAMLFALSLLGFVLSLAWAPLITRNLKYRDIYMKKGRQIEEQNHCEGPLIEGYKLKLQFSKVEDAVKEKYLGVIVPLFFAAGFLLLCLISLRKLC